MMELWCVSVLVLCSLVTANPYGYGVKSGASARAEASAVAVPFGNFGASPLSIPGGAGGYSGSYSKSSSSSFASSSASSSASSYSFSGSGNIPAVGANGLSGANGIVIPGSDGCTGGCQTEKHGLAGSLSGDSTGNGQTYSGAKAAATAGSTVFGVSKTNQGPCTSGDCSKQTPTSCKGSNCDGSVTDSEKCTSEKCGPTSETGTSSTAYGSNDIYVNNYKNSNNVKSEVAATGPECLNGNCGSADTSSKPYTNDSPGAIAGEQKKPATTLSTPKLDAPCTSANCGSTTGSIYDKPSSYNVPIHGSYTGSSTQGSKPCTSGNCGNDQSYSPHLSSLSSPSAVYPQDVSGSANVAAHSQENSSGFLPLGSSSPANCGTPNCVGSSLNPNGKPTSPESKYSTNTGQQAFSASSAVSASGANVIAGNYVTPKSSDTVGTTTQKIPTYTGGFGGPPGFLKPPTTSYKHTASVASYKSGASQPTTSPQISQNIPTSGQQHQPVAPVGAYTPGTCSTGNCGTQPGQPSTQYNKAGLPNGQQYKPTVAAGSYGSSSCSSGNCGSTLDVPSSQYGDNKLPNGAPTGPAGSYYPPGCSFGNCGSQSGLSSPAYGQSSSSSGANYNPTSLSGSSYSPGSCTSGNCGLPGQSVPQYSQSGSSGGTSYKPSIPAGSYPSTCTSGNCGVPTISSSPSATPYKPIAPVETSNPTICSSGSCGQSGQISSHQGQSGLQSNVLNKPIAPAGAYPTGCLSGNCGSQAGQTSSHQYQNGLQSSVQYKPAGPSGTYNPTTCTTGNCAPQTSQPLPLIPQSGASSAAQYQPPVSTGMFGGPAGILKPNEFNIPSNVPSSNYKPTAPAGSINPGACSTTGTCGSQPGQPSPQYISSGPQYKPSVPAGPSGTSSLAAGTGSYKPTACVAGNCGAPVSSAPQYGQSGTTGSQATAGAVANANAVVYTGGFGGPPGLLKPYDDGKLGSATVAGGKYPSGSQTGSGYHGSTTGSGLQSSYGKSLNGVGAGAQADAGAGAGAQSGAGAGAGAGRETGVPSGAGAQSGAGTQTSAVSGATAGAYGGNYNNLGCNGGCGLNSDGNFGLHGSSAGASAKSVANAVSSAGARSFGGSYASSSASAYASSGAFTKGGYGRR